MTDHELLELAAKAIDLTLRYNYLGDRDARQPWNPLTDDGDALRLAVKLGLLVYVSPYKPAENAWGHVTCAWYGQHIKFDPEQFTDDPYAATRHAIVRAAAEIERSKK